MSVPGLYLSELLTKPLGVCRDAERRPGPRRLIKPRPGDEVSFLTSHACEEELLVCPLGLSGSSDELLRGSSGLRASSVKLTVHLLPGVEVVS